MKQKNKKENFSVCYQAHQLLFYSDRVKRTKISVEGVIRAAEGTIRASEGTVRAGPDFQCQDFQIFKYISIFKMNLDLMVLIKE